MGTNIPTPAQLMMGYRLISDLPKVDIHDKDEKIAEERYQQKRTCIQDPRVVPNHTLYEPIFMQNPVNILWSAGTIVGLTGSPGSYIVCLQNYGKV